MPRLTPLRVIVGAAVAGILVPVAAGLVLVALFLAGVSPHFDRSDLIGVYVAKYPSGTETLTLKPDGTFLQEVTLKEPQDSTPVTRTGSWTWDESAQRLRLHDGMAVNDGFGDISPTLRTDSGGDTGAERKWWFFGQILLGDRDSAPLWKVD
jgi:hypothetical protein